MTRTAATDNGVVVEDASAYARKLRRRIRRFEKRYEMPTETMKTCVKVRAINETAEIAEWLYDDAALALLEGCEETSTAG